ncbi:MAG: hypothetical protein ACI9N1_000270 [Flavobacteriales bacterium]|jgi:hypothetical protein
MNYPFTLLVCFLSHTYFAQIDSTTDYKDRFYANDTLLTKNETIENKKDGYWIEYFDKKWVESTKKKSKYYRLIEYKNGLPVGKVYDFYRSGKLQMLGEFKSLEPNLRIGTTIWYTKSGKRTRLEFQNEDTFYESEYYANGKLSYEQKFLRGRDQSSYYNRNLYYKNGNPLSLDFRDKDLDSSHYEDGRRNGTTESEEIYSSEYSKYSVESKNGKTLDISTRYIGSDSIFEEKYENNILIEAKIKMTYPDSGLYLNKYKKVIHYQGQVGDNTGVLVLNKEGVNYYQVNGVEMTEEEYQNYLQQYNEYLSKRQETHFYKEYSADSIPFYEGLFKNVDQHCGSYVQYHSNGKPHIYGFYDKKGRMSKSWMYFDEQGEILKSEYYKKGVKRE